MKTGRFLADKSKRRLITSLNLATLPVGLKATTNDVSLGIYFDNGGSNNWNREHRSMKVNHLDIGGLTFNNGFSSFVVNSPLGLVKKSADQTRWLWFQKCNIPITLENTFQVLGIRNSGLTSITLPSLFSNKISNNPVLFNGLSNSIIKHWGQESDAFQLDNPIITHDHCYITWWVTSGLRIAKLRCFNGTVESACSNFAPLWTDFFFSYRSRINSL